MAVIKDESVLQEARARWRCEYCGRQTPSGCDPAHIYSRGAGQVDIPENVCSLCWQCHRVESHNGRPPTRDDLLSLAAARCGTTPDKITDAVHAVRRARTDQDRDAAILALRQPAE